jgi:hypothetical protein
MALWSTIFIEIWKRREHELAHLWNMSHYKGNEAEMPNYKADLVIDSRTKNAKKQNVVDSYFRRLMGEAPVVTTGIGVVVGCFIGYRTY